MQVLLGPFVLRRTKSGVASQLVPKQQQVRPSRLKCYKPQKHYDMRMTLPVSCCSCISVSGLLVVKKGKNLFEVRVQSIAALPILIELGRCTRRIHVAA